MTGQFPLGQSRQCVLCVLVTLHRTALSHVICLPTFSATLCPAHHATQPHGAAGCQGKAIVNSQAFLCPSLESPRTLHLLSDSSHGRPRCPPAALQS